MIPASAKDPIDKHTRWLLENLRELALPHEEYMLVGSVPLKLRDIIDRPPTDLDLMLTPQALSRLYPSGLPTKPYNGSRVLYLGEQKLRNKGNHIFDIKDDPWLSGNDSLPECIRDQFSRAHSYFGIRMSDPRDTAFWKRIRQGTNDADDLKAIETAGINCDY